LYYRGTGVTKDFAQAVKYFQQAATQQSVEAICWLGECAKKGEGVPQSTENAIQFYTVAAGMGYGPAKVMLKALQDERAEAQNGVFIDDPWAR